MRDPETYCARIIKDWNVDRECKNGIWIPARPLGHNIYPLMSRFKTAWRVLIGKYDALNWEEEYYV